MKIRINKDVESRAKFLSFSRFAKHLGIKKIVMCLGLTLLSFLFYVLLLYAKQNIIANILIFTTIFFVLIVNIKKDSISIYKLISKVIKLIINRKYYYIDDSVLLYEKVRGGDDVKDKKRKGKKSK